MDPKKALEGFRVDATIPKELPNPKQKYKQSNVILIIFCATMLGLSTGIGSAFAFSSSELHPSQSPLDEPTTKVQIEQHVPEVELNSKNTDLAPLEPPIDEPTENESVNETEVKSEKKLESKHEKKQKNTESIGDNDHASRHQKESTAKKEEQSKPDKSEKQIKSEKFETKSVNPKQEEKQEMPKVQSSSNSSPKTTQKESTSSTSVVSSETQQKSVSVTNENSKTASVSKENITSSKKDVTSATQTNPKSVPANDVPLATDETPDPKTKTGTLPETAGDELNHALACLVVVCFSIAYLLAKKETHPES